ncbi:MAG TPA: hypothetical protein V6D08_03515 [Candidatus Obscuribacterales bacterium]
MSKLNILRSLLAAALVVSLSGCAAGIGVVGGGAVGAILDQKNPWRGGVVGGLIGGTLGAFVDIVSRDAALSGRTVEREHDGYRVVAVPRPHPARHCSYVQERVYHYGTLVREYTRTVCR